MVPHIQHFGTIQTSHELTGLTPQGVVVECIRWNTLRVQWSEIPNEKSLISAYGVCYRQEKDVSRCEADWNKITLRNTDHSCLIKNLKPYVDYSIFVYARSAVDDLETCSKIYSTKCTGGFIVGISSNGIHVYDIIRDEWKRLTSMDGLDLFKPALIMDINQGNLIRVGGEKKFCHFAQLHLMNLATLETKSLPSMKIKRACCQAAFVPCTR